VVGDTRLVKAVPKHGGACGDRQASRIDAPGQRGCRGGRGEGRAGHGEERQARLQRCEAADALQVLGHEEEPAHQHAVEQEPRRVGAGADAVGEEAQRHERLGGAVLSGDEHGEEGSADRQRADGGGVAPSGICGVHDAEHDGAHASGRAQGVEDVQAPGVPLGLRQHTRRGEDRRDADRDVEQEAEPPRQRRREHAADDQTEGGPETGQRPVRSHRPGALRSFGEAGRQERQRGGREDRCADALDGAGRDHPGRRLRKADREGRRGEHPDADHEHAPATKEIAGAGAQQQQAAEGQGVRVLRP